MWTFIGLLIIILLIIGGASIVFSTFKTGISPMPSSSKVKKCIEEILPDKIQGTVYELGCGWGGLAFLLALRYPESEVKAYEVSPIPWLYTYLLQRFYRLENMTLYWKDFFLDSLEDASLVVCYLYPGAMERLRKKFEKELKPGTLVVSNTFAIPEWEPEEVIKVNDFYRTKVYIYRMK